MYQKSVPSCCYFHIGFDATSQIQLLIVASQECLQLCTSQEVEESSTMHDLIGEWKGKFSAR